MKPTVGRIVHYVSYGTPGGEYQPEHRAAIVSGVPVPKTDGTFGGNDEAHLVVMNPTGLFFNEFVEHDEEEKRGGTWHWPERDDE